MDKKAAGELIDELLHQEQAPLRQLPYGELIDLPPVSQRSVSPEGRDASLSTYRDLLPDRTVRIVTQYYRRGFLGSARVRAKGFAMDTAGSARELGESELWDFT